MQSEKNYTQQYSLLTKLFISGGIVGPLLFIVVFLIEGATRPGYSVWRNYVSDLALSNQGWEQIANFLICGFLCIAFAVGLRRIWHTGRGSVWGPMLVGLFGLGLIIAGTGVPFPIGLTQRAQIIIGWGWLSLTALRLLRQEPKAMLDEASTRLILTNTNPDK